MAQLDAGFTDQLLTVMRHAIVALPLRQVCKAWLTAIDRVDPRSDEWRQLLLAFKVRGSFPMGTDLKAAYYLLVCEPSRLLAAAADLARRWDEGLGNYMRMPDGNFVYQPDAEAKMRRRDTRAAGMLDKLLAWLYKVGEAAACEWLLEINDAVPGTPLLNDALALFNNALTYVSDKFSSAVRNGLPQKLHQSWEAESRALADRIADRMHDAPPEAKARAVASFESFVRKIQLRCFGKLDIAFVSAIPLGGAVAQLVELGEAPGLTLRALPVAVQLIGAQAVHALRERLQG
eukprot:Transcript_29601.p1 GENE.Transcript_29601~~Transcript_29601.p1  ORF type:complete len:309 (+),score=81.04 Transcript_29601:60-929(+)